MTVSAYYTLDQIVREYLLEIPESQRSLKEYRRYFNFALSGLRRLRTTVTKDGKKRLKVTPDDLNIIDFPDDAEELIYVYVPVAGRIWRLTVDNDIIPTTTTVGIDVTDDEDYGEGVDQQISQFDSFIARGGINIEGYITVNYETREIRVNNNRKTELVLEYSSLRSTTNIPTKYVEAIKAWITWKSSLKDRTVSLAERKENMALFLYEVREIKKIEGPSQWELLDAWNSKSTVRG